jgi:4-amino-4-deoxy-L-arabinose transferase-like glycosyltransferase
VESSFRTRFSFAARPWAVSTLLFALTAASSILFELRGRLRFSSDQGIISLMAVDILKKGVHPLFCYGAEYAGTLEAHYLALVFGLLGPSVAAFRIGIGLLLALVVVATGWVARLAYGARAGLFAGLYLACGPAYFLHKGLTSDGSYTSLLLLLALALGLLLRIEGRLARGAPALRELALLGLLSGIAWWVHPLSICIAPLAAVACLLGTTRAWLAPRGLALGTAGFLAGATPWIYRNLQTGWASLRAQEMAPAAVGGIRGTTARLAELLSQALPRLLGARPVGFHFLTPTFPGAPKVALLLLATLTGFALLSLSTRSTRLGSALFLTLLAAIPLLSLGVARTDFTEPRYLLPLYLAVAPLAGGLLAAWSRRPARFALPLALLVAALVALGPGSELRAPRGRYDVASQFESDPYRLLADLHARGVREIYASYWSAYRLAFLSGGELAASPFGNGENGLVRDAALRERLDRTPQPAFLLCCEDLPRFTAYLDRAAVPHRTETVEGFTLFTGLPPETVAKLRACYCIPESPRPGDIAWLSIAGPPELQAGREGRYRVTFENRGPAPLSSNVHLSYHWIANRIANGVANGGGPPVEGLRIGLPTQKSDWWRYPWRQVTVEARVPAGVPPGDYALVFDLVDENVSWFADHGLSPAPYRVVITPASP